MERKLTIINEIDAGEKTCASAPGVFCKFAGSRRFGTEAVCLLFTVPGTGSPRTLNTTTGWMLRLPECLAAEGAFVDQERRLQVAISAMGPLGTPPLPDKDLESEPEDLV